LGQVVEGAAERDLVGGEPCRAVRESPVCWSRSPSHLSSSSPFTTSSTASVCKEGMPVNTVAPPTRAKRREWIGLAVIALPCLLYSMDLTVLNLAVPSLSADLKPSSTQLLWIIDIYGFLVAGSLITMGTLGDRIG